MHEVQIASLWIWKVLCIESDKEDYIKEHEHLEPAQENSSEIKSISVVSHK